MSDDLVERLRDWEHVWPDDMDKPAGHLYDDAADRIEELEANLAKAVEFISNLKQYAVAIDDRHLHGKTVATLAELTGEYNE